MNIDLLLSNLDSEYVKILREQIERFEKCSSIPRKIVDINESIIFPEGTLIHGTPADKRILESISQTGIITGQAFGIEEDGETYYCADFHRVNTEQSLESYNTDFKYSDGRCPFGIKGKGTVAFVLYPDVDMKDLIAYDCYRSNSKESDVTREFVNVNGLPLDDTSLGSSILFGVPSNFISGIVVGDKSINIDMVSFLIEKFPGCFISRNDGEIIYKNGDSFELVEARIKSIQRQIMLEEKMLTQQQLSYRINVVNGDSEKLWDAIATLPIDVIASIYEKIGWQEDFLVAAEKLKKQRCESDSMKM